MKKKGYKEFIKIDTNNLYINKNTISSFLSNANQFFKSFQDFSKNVNNKLDYFEVFAKDANKKLEDANKKLDYLIRAKEKEPEDSKSKSNSKKSENISPNESNTPFDEENEKESHNSKEPADSTRKINEKKKKKIEKNNQNNANVSSISINSQFFLYKKNINELIDNDDINK